MGLRPFQMEMGSRLDKCFENKWVLYWWKWLDWGYGWVSQFTERAKIYWYYVYALGIEHCFIRAFYLDNSHLERYSARWTKPGGSVEAETSWSSSQILVLQLVDAQRAQMKQSRFILRRSSLKQKALNLSYPSHETLKQRLKYLVLWKLYQHRICNVAMIIETLSKPPEAFCSECGNNGYKVDD